MFSESMVFSSFSTNKLLDSYLFYRELLGLDARLINDRFVHLYLPSGHTHVIYYKPDHHAADFTVLNFQITEIAEVVDQLTHKGITFLQFDEPFNTDKKGISWDEEGSHIAWFKDPGENIIALIEN